MLKFLIILIVVFILFGIFRRMMFGSFYAAMKKYQHDQEQREREELKRKREGKISIEQIKPGKFSDHDDGEYVDYEELK